MGMKRRYLAVLMGIMVAASAPAAVYAEDAQATEAEQNESTESDTAKNDADKDSDSEENVIRGEVKSVSDTEITISVKDPEKTDEADEEQTVPVTENTVITKKQGGAPQGQPGEAPEKPEGDAQSEN